LVGLMTFSYMHSLHEQAQAEPLRAIARVQTTAE
jgi:hypothetical protein